MCRFSGVPTKALGFILESMASPRKWRSINDGYHSRPNEYIICIKSISRILKRFERRTA